ncbi:MAG: deoxyribose-phosphate aldolase [Candidatus Dadabacteria bacterium]|nr:MAG: deoxyribose-phosphate aldolase [Candidatus Dadabacteria bacterium]
MDREALRSAIESTLLSPVASAAQVEALCREAAEHGWLGVCVSPCRVAEAAGHLRGTGVRVVTVVGFPLGTSSTRAKAGEVEQALRDGAEEVDAVWNVGWFLEGRYRAVAEELRTLRTAAGDRVLKVILETAYLDPPRLKEAGALALGCGADFLKTSTGFGPRGASLDDVRVLRQVARGRCGVKASGGIRTLEQAVALLDAGADRIGTSSAGAIWAEAGARQG